jgi:hypothetical protein
MDLHGWLEAAIEFPTVDLSMLESQQPKAKNRFWLDARAVVQVRIVSRVCLSPKCIGEGYL